jgi:Flp pilus assembly protein TadG
MREPMRSGLRLLRGDESGSMLLESAVSLTVFLAVAFGIMDCSRALYVQQFVGSAAKQASRYAMVRGASWSGRSCGTTSATSCTASSSNVQAFVMSLAPPGVGLSNLTVNVQWPGTMMSGTSCTAWGSANSPGCMVKVQVQYPFSFVLPFLPSNLMQFSATSAGVIAQ